MDLLETTDGARHPWERSRAAFFTGVVARSLGDVRGLDVLDVGAGDAFFAAQLADELGPRSVTCWDACYDDATMARLSARSPTLSFTRSRPERRFDLAIMLDVIEHVEDDVAFVRQIVGEGLQSGGHVLVSVPAWQPLFSRHDELLRHHRRYSPAACDRVLAAAGLTILMRGGLFHSLILPRAATVARERLRPRRAREEPLATSAAATWTGGPAMTFAVDLALRGDNVLSRAAARVGLNLPGLSYWALARK